MELTPGPNMVWLALLSARQGRRAGFAATLGIALGLGLLALAAVFGLAQLVAEYPLLYQGICLTGVAFMVWLAWDAWRDPADQASWANSVQQTSRLAFLRGLLINVLNAKAAMFFLTVLPNFIDPQRAITQQYLLLTGIYLSIATAIHVILVLGGNRLGRLVIKQAHSTAVRAVSALALLGVAAWMLAKL
ncbi:LysE family translocator [Aurantiacibacter marinus]|uniref:LysE family translocator n=1 Tax=Aurantiacibacter marinus TaxID=874156 RepID=UPI0022B1A807|nr:LysE family translocator [Aurantiacibacter marinus]